MWVPGNNLSPVQVPSARTGSRLPRLSADRVEVARGFTLVELLLVLAIIAMVSAGVSFALRDTSQTQLEREAQRLVALLESARAQSRASGLPVYWRADATGFEFVGLPVIAGASFPGGDAGERSGQGTTTPWLAPGVSVRVGTVVTLGPEPIIERQQIILVQADQSLRIATDGLHGFAVAAAEPDDAARETR